MNHTARLLALLWATTLLGLPLAAQDDPSAGLSDDELKAIAYKADIGIPLPIIAPRKGFPVMNLFDPEAWPTSILGLGWGLAYQDLGDVQVRSLSVSAWGGLGGMYHPTRIGELDLKTDTRKNSDWFAGASFGTVLVPMDNLALDLGANFDASPNSANDWWNTDIGLNLELSRNPYLPAEGLVGRLGWSTAMSSGSLANRARLTVSGYLPLVDDTLVAGLTLDGGSFVGTGVPELAWLTQADQIGTLSPQVWLGDSGSLGTGESAWSARAFVRFRAARIQGFIDVVSQFFGPLEPEPAWRNGTWIYLEPFGFYSGYRHGETLAAPSWGGGLAFRFARSYGHLTNRPFGVEFGCDASKLASGNWFFFNFLL